MIGTVSVFGSVQSAPVLESGSVYRFEKSKPSVDFRGYLGLTVESKVGGKDPGPESPRDSCGHNSGLSTDSHVSAGPNLELSSV